MMRDENVEVSLGKGNKAETIKGVLVISNALAVAVGKVSLLVVHGCYSLRT